MKALESEELMGSLHAEHNRRVKSEYQCNLDVFADWLSAFGHENEETKEFYVEIPQYETKSGHAEILDW